MAASTPQIPPGGTFFDTIKRSFVDVPVDAQHDDAIATEPFLEATESLVGLFDILGSVAFKPVRADMTGNVTKIRTRLLADPVAGQTLQGLVRSELATGKHVATEGLVWLVRGLHFTSLALRQNLSNPTQELSESFRNAYASTLKPHHSFVVKPIFSAAMSATPYRKDFYARLGEDQVKLQAEIATWLDALEKQVAILRAFLDRKEAKW